MSNVFYHGTEVRSAYSIMTQGFKIGEEIHGRVTGYGLYITEEPRFAAYWGEVIIECRLAEGSRVLWETAPNARVLDSLRREFGAQVLTLDFFKALPRTKQLTRKEARNLWQHLHAQQRKLWQKDRPKDPQHWFDRLGRVFDHLRRHGFAGVGSHDSEWPEILIFNPSDVSPITAHHFTSTSDDGWLVKDLVLSDPVSLDQLQREQEPALAEWNSLSEE